MSKSKKNIVDPEEMINMYGADSIRWFMLSDSPPERDLEWTVDGIEGAWRFTQRLWRTVTQNLQHIAELGAEEPTEFSPVSSDLRRMTHQSIESVSRDIENFHFNAAVAQLYKFNNAVNGFKETAAAGDRWALREAIETLVMLVSPMMPHLAEELWVALGHNTLAAESPWPELKQQWLAADTVTMAVQIKGKLRDTLDVPVDMGKDEIENMALNLPKIKSLIDGAEIRKVIVVPGKIVNIVI